MSVYVTLDMVFPPLLKDEVVFWQCFFRLGNYPLPRTGICGLILQYSVGRQWVDYIARAACGFISTEGGILVVKRPAQLLIHTFSLSHKSVCLGCGGF